MNQDRDDLDPLRGEMDWKLYEARQRAREQVVPLSPGERLRDIGYRWLRVIGYPTRAITYLVALVVGEILVWSWLAPSEPLTNRPIGSLTVGEIGNVLLYMLLAGGGAIMLFKGFFAEEDGGFEYVEWEAWGKFGLVLLAAAAAASIWALVV